MLNETTQELLQRLKDSIEHYDPKEWDDISLEELRFDYKMAKEISNTLDLCEIRLLWLLRCSPCDDELFRFTRAAETLLQAYQKFYDLEKPSPIDTVDGGKVS